MDDQPLKAIVFVKRCPQCEGRLHMQWFESTEMANGVEAGVCQNEECRKVWGPGALKAIAFKSGRMQVT